VQGWIDQGGLRGRAVTASALLDVHRRFGELLPPELLTVENPETGEMLEVVPGALRQRHVKVGGHVPVSPGAVPRFLGRFEEVYGRLGRAETILATAAAHHRLLWIHPFLDGNGRVARFLETCLDQVRFMESLVQPDRLRARMVMWAQEDARACALPARAGQLLEAVLYRGTLPRGDVPALLDTSERNARRVVSALVDR